MITNKELDELMEAIDAPAKKEKVVLSDSTKLVEAFIAEAIAADGDTSFDALFEDTIDHEEKTLAESFDALLEDIFPEEIQKLEEKTIMKLDKKASLRKAISIEAMQLAKTDAPALYEKYKKSIALKKKIEELILKKFKTKAVANIKKAK